MNFQKASSSYPHDALQSILVKKPTLFSGFLQPEDEPGAGNPVGVELVGRHRLEELLLVDRHEPGLHNMVECGEALLDCRGDGAKDEDHRQVHPAHQRSAKHS